MVVLVVLVVVWDVQFLTMWVHTNDVVLSGVYMVIHHVNHLANHKTINNAVLCFVFCVLCFVFCVLCFVL